MTTHLGRRGTQRLQVHGIRVVSVSATAAVGLSPTRYQRVDVTARHYSGLGFANSAAKKVLSLRNTVRFPLYADDFDRVDSATLGSNWSQIGNTVPVTTITSNQAFSGGAGGQINAWTTAVGADQYSYLESTDLNGVGPACRISIGANYSASSFYRVIVSNPDIFLYWKPTGTTSSTVIKISTGTVSGTTSLALEAIGTTFNVYKNGTLLFSATHSGDTTTPYAGFFFGGTGQQGDNWSAGEMVAGNRLALGSTASHGTAAQTFQNFLGAATYAATKKINVAAGLLPSGFAPNATAKKVVTTAWKQRYLETFPTDGALPSPWVVGFGSASVVSGRFLTSGAGSHTAYTPIAGPGERVGYIQFNTQSPSGSAFYFLGFADTTSLTNQRRGVSVSETQVTAVFGNVSVFNTSVGFSNTIRVELFRARCVVFIDGVQVASVAATNASAAAPTDYFGIQASGVVTVDNVEWGIYDGPTTVVGNGPMVAGSKVGKSVATARNGYTAITSTLKVSTPTATGTSGHSPIVAATRVSAGVAVAAVNSLGAAATALAAKVAKAAINAATGQAPTSVAKKVVITTGRAATGETSTTTTRKVTPATLLGMVSSGLQTVLAKKNVTPTVLGEVGSTAASAAQKRSTSTVRGNFGGAATAAALKKVTATVSGNFGSGPSGFGSKLGRIVSAANVLSSGLQTVLAKKISAATIKELFGAAPISTEKKIALIRPRYQDIDTFLRADAADLGVNWITGTGNSHRITSFRATETSAANRVDVWATPLNTSSHYVQAIFVSVGASGFWSLIARCSDVTPGGTLNSVGSFYGIGTDGTNLFLFRKASGSTTLTTIATITRTLIVNEVVRLEVDNQYLRGYVNNVLVIQATDATFSTGFYVGLFSKDASGSTYDNFVWSDLWSGSDESIGTGLYGVARKVAPETARTDLSGNAITTPQKVGVTTATGAGGATSVSSVVKNATIAALQALEATVTAAATKISTPQGYANVGSSAQAVVAHVVAASVNGLNTFAGNAFSTARKVIGISATAKSETTGTVTAQKNVLAILVAASGSYARALVTKVSTPTSIGNTGTATTSAATKTSIVAATQYASGVATGIGSKLGRIVYAAAALASGLSQAVAEKISISTGRGVTGTTGTATANKVGVTIANLNLGDTALAAARKVGTPLVSLVTGQSPRVLASKIAKATGQQEVGTSATGLAKKIVGAAARGTVGVWEVGLTGTVQLASITARHFMGATSRVLASRKSAVSASETNGASATGTARKVSSDTARTTVGATNTATAAKRLTATARAAFGQASNAMYIPIIYIAATARNFFSVVQNAVAQKVTSDSATTSVGVESEAVGSKKAPASGLTTTASSQDAVVIKRSTPIVALRAVATSAAAVKKRALSVINQGAGLYAAATGSKTATATSTVETGQVETATSRKVSINDASLDTATQVIAFTSTRRALSAAARLGASLKAIVQAFLGQVPNVENGTVAIAVDEAVVELDVFEAVVTFTGGEAFVRVDQEYDIETPTGTPSVGDLDVVIGD